MPWKLLADPSGYIFTWLLGYSGGLGSIAGVLIADYWIVRQDAAAARGPLPARRRLSLQRAAGTCRGVVATLAGCAAAWGGLVVPALQPLYDYAWFVGFGVARGRLPRAREKRNDMRTSPAPCIAHGRAARVSARAADPALLREIRRSTRSTITRTSSGPCPTTTTTMRCPSRCSIRRRREPKEAHSSCAATRPDSSARGKRSSPIPTTMRPART